MIKIFLSILAGTILIVGGYFVWTNVFGKFHKIEDTANVLIEPQKELQQYPKEVLGDVQENLDNIRDNFVNEVTNFTHEQAQEAVDNIFEKNNPQKEVKIAVVDSDTVVGQPYVIDLAQGNKIQVSIKKNSKYYLQFKNVKVDTCLYIGENKYKLEHNTNIELSFSTSGSYKLKVDNCETKDNDLGQIVVE